MTPRYQTPIGRLARLMMALEKALNDAQEFLWKTQESDNLYLQTEAAWLVHHISEVIEHGNQVLARVKPIKKLYPRENRS